MASSGCVSTLAIAGGSRADTCPSWANPIPSSGVLSWDKKEYESVSLSGSCCRIQVLVTADDHVTFPGLHAKDVKRDPGKNDREREKEKERGRGGRREGRERESEHFNGSKCLAPIVPKVQLFLRLSCSLVICDRSVFF